MKRKDLSRQLLCGLLAITLGITSTVSLTQAKDDENQFTWEKVENFENDRLNKFEERESESAYADDEEVRALVVFDEASLLEKGYSANSINHNWFARNYMQRLESNQEKMIDKISQEVLDENELDVRYNFTVLTNAVSTDLTYKEVKEIRDIDGVKDVYVLPQYEVQAVADADPNTITSGEMVGSYNTW